MIKIDNISGNLIKVLVPETLKSDDFTQLATEADAIIKKHGKVRLLVDASQFDGWENLPAFEKHLAFVKSHQKKVERIAVIAKHNWQHWMVGVIKAFVHPEIRVFDKDEAGVALQWISEEKEIIGMMEILKDFPDDVLAIRAHGRVTQKDYDDVLIPAANAAFARHPKLRVYYETEPGFTGFEAGAMWKDFTYGVGHWTGWERIALVTDVDWIKHMANAFRFLIPCPMKFFAPDQSAQAHEWVVKS